jgi:signal transduction histidine kinase
MFIVPLLAALTNSLYRLNTFHQEATSTLLQVEATKFSNQEAILKVKATAREQVENELSDLLSVTRQQILNFQHEPLEVQFEKISKVLTQSAIEIVRPLSHQLSTDTVRVDSRLRFLDVATESLRSNPFLVWSNSFLIAFGTFLTISREKLSIMSTVIVCLSQFVLVGCTMYLARRAQRRTKNYGVLLLVSIDLLITYLSWSVMNRFMDDYLFLLPQRLFVNFLWVLIVVVGTGFLSNFVNIKDGATNIVLRTIDDAQFNILLLESELQQTKKDIARYLHGNLQSRMMALSLTLDMAKDKSSKDELASALSIADSLLLSPFADYVQTEALPLVEEVTKVVSRWAGLLAISTDIEDIDDKISSYQNRAIGATIEEAIGNSLRHGFAKSVWIRVFENASDIVVEVVDDGVGPRSHVAGMGSRLYDAVASKGWSLEFRVEGTGSILSLRL